MEQKKKVLVEIDYISVPRLKKKRRHALENISSRANKKKQVVMVIDRSQLSRETVVEAVKKHLCRRSSKTTAEVVDYRILETEEKSNKNIN